MKQLKFTGLLDRHCLKIYEGDLIWNGMRRGDPNGWTVERVVKKPRRKCKAVDLDPWYLADPITGEIGQMQWDQELRDKLGKPIYKRLKPRRSK